MGEYTDSVYRRIKLQAPSSITHGRVVDECGMVCGGSWFDKPVDHTWRVSILLLL